MRRSNKGVKAKRQNWLTENSLKIFESRYYDKESGETKPEHVFKRVSLGNKDYFNLMNDGLFLPNSPTLFNCGLNNGGTLSACFVFDISDCLLGDWPDGGKDSPFPDSILGTTFKAAAVAKAGGGVGYYFGNIREEGSEVRSTHKKACGPVAVLRWLNGLNALITQGGKRALAQMGVLNADHPDIMKFIRCKDDDPQGIGSFNISVSWKDKMLGEIDWDEADTLQKMNIAPIPGEHISNTDLWYVQACSAWKTGDPGMLFWDVINRANATPHLGDINATNPCGETPNLNNEPCNLGSLAVHRFARRTKTGYTFDWPALREAVKTATRFLDDILDENVFPHPAITRAAKDTRKLGLGVMGYADLLALLNIPYDSEEGVTFGQNLMEEINQTAMDESVRLANTKGVYPAWSKTKSPKWATRCRNSTRTSIAPTGTISILAGTSSSIEPHYELEWERTTNEGHKLTERIGVWDELGGFVPKTANEIDWRWHVKHQAAFQKHTDLGVSKTINMPKTATVKDMSDAYRMMWETGCKGGTVFRDGCRDEQVLVAKPRKTQSVYMTTSVVKEGEEEVVKSYEIDLTKSGEAKEIPTGVDFGKLGPMAMHNVNWRDKPVETTTADNKEYRTYSTAEPPIPVRPKDSLCDRYSVMKQSMPKTATSVRHGFKIGGTKGYLHVGLFADGRPGEIFMRVAAQGSAVQGMMDAWAMGFSTSLQSGVPLADLVKLHKGSRFDPSGVTGDPDVPICTSIVDFVVRWMEKRYQFQPATLPKSEWIGNDWGSLTGPPTKEQLDLAMERLKNNPGELRPFGPGLKETTTSRSTTGELCPDCGGELVRQGALCMACTTPGCGFSKC